MRTILNKIILVLEDLLKTGSYKDYESYIKITPNKVSATDGAILLEIKNKNNDSEVSNGKGEIFLSKDHLKKIKKVLAKEVDNFVVERDDDKIKIFIEDYDGETELKFPAKDIQYPDTEQIYRDTEPKLTIAFSLVTLKKLVEVLYKLRQATKGIKTDKVEFLLYSDEEPVEIKYKSEDLEVRGAVMPLRRI